MRTTIKRALALCLTFIYLTIPVVGTMRASAQSGASNWPAGTMLLVNPNVSFVWVRGAPASNGSVIQTIYPNYNVTVVNGQAIWDGVQWWWLVTAFNNTRGWVEQNSLLLAPPPGTTRATAVPRPTLAAIPPPDWSIGTLVILNRQGLYAWLRSEPNSYAEVVTTVGYTLRLVVNGGANNEHFQWDGVQWWVYVRTLGIAPNYGWVEAKSLMLATDTSQNPTVSPQTWTVGTVVRVKANIPFSWVRSDHTSYSPTVYVVNSGGMLELSAPAVFDGVQWWWQVKVSGTQTTGWVEQNSMELVYTRTPFSTEALPTSGATATLQVFEAIFQQFEHGFLLWRADRDCVYAFSTKPPDPNIVIPKLIGFQEFGVYHYCLEVASLPTSMPGTPSPSGALGKIYSFYAEIREALGNPTANEVHYRAKIPTFSCSGEFMCSFMPPLLTLPDGRTLSCGMRAASAGKCEVSS